MDLIGKRFPDPDQPPAQGRTWNARIGSGIGTPSPFTLFLRPLNVLFDNLFSESLSDHRLRGRSGFGPMSEIHAGSGHYSQNATTLVMTLPEPCLEVWVRWPGGRITRKDVTPDLSEIRIKNGDQDR